MLSSLNLPLSKRVIRASSSQPPPFTFGDSASYSRGTYRTWDKTSMKQAVEAVEKGVTVRKAAELYSVPRSTLHDRLSGKTAEDSRSGPQPYLSWNEEEELTSFLLQAAKIGYPYTRKQILALVQQIVHSKGITTTVTNGWWERFLKRHPQLTLRVAVPLSYARAMASDPEVIDRYFDMLEDCLQSNGLFNKAPCIYNCDETGVPLDPKCMKVIDEVGSKNPSYLTGGSKSQITVLACTCAAGYPIPPLVIFDRMTLNNAMTKGEVPGSIYGLSHNGWITRDIFREWFKHFLRSIPPVRPVILFLDGHSAHYCPETIRMAAEEKVILCALPPHTTHLLQPLDKGCFSPLKVNWREICHQFCASNPGRTVSRHDFCELFSKAWYKAFNQENIINSFKATGICPFNRGAVHLSSDDDEFSSFKPNNLAERTGLAYIPLYSPARRHVAPASNDHIGQATSRRFPHQSHSTPMNKLDCSRSHATLLSVSEPNLLDQSLFETYDNPTSRIPLPGATTISKFLVLPKPPNQIPTKRGKSAGRVLTSLENLQMLQQKEKLKQEEALKKEERKRMRQEKASKKLVHVDAKQEGEEKGIIYFKIWLV